MTDDQPQHAQPVATPLLIGNRGFVAFPIIALTVEHGKSPNRGHDQITFMAHREGGERFPVYVSVYNDYDETQKKAMWEQAQADLYDAVAEAVSQLDAESAASPIKTLHNVRIADLIPTREDDHANGNT